MAPIPGKNREEPERIDGDDTTVSSLDGPQLALQAGSSDSEEGGDDSDAAYAGYQVRIFKIYLCRSIPGNVYLVSF